MMIVQSIPARDLKPGMQASLSRTVTHRDLALFAALSGDRNPAHLDAAFAEASPFRGVIAHGLWGGGLISAVIGMKLPGPGAIYLSQNLKFIRPVRPGDAVEAGVTVREADAKRGRVILDCRLTANGEPAIEGEARVLAPREAIRREVEDALTAVVIERPTRLAALYANFPDAAPLAVRLEGGPDLAAGLARAEALGIVRVGPGAAVAVCDTPGDAAAGLILIDAPAAPGLLAVVWGDPALWSSPARAAGLCPEHRVAADARGFMQAAERNGPAILVARDAVQARIAASALDALGGAAAVELSCGACGVERVVGDDRDGFELAAGLAVARAAHRPAIA